MFLVFGLRLGRREDKGPARSKDAHLQLLVLTVITRKSSLLSIILLFVFSLSILCSVQRSKLLISEDHRVMTHPPVGGLPINSTSNSSKWELYLLYSFYILVKLCQHGLMECILNFGSWSSIILIILLLKYLTIGSYYSVICYTFLLQHKPLWDLVCCVIF